MPMKLLDNDANDPKRKTLAKSGGKMAADFID